MKYNPPYGSTDPNAAYVDRNTPGAIAGSRVPASAIEHPQREIMAVIANAGLDPSSADLTQLLKAIQNMISAATGGSGDTNYVLMTQARVRLPIFPEVVASDGRLAVISPSTGVVRIMPGYDFLHRGIFNVTTVQQDFATVASKTYHLRWNPTDGYSLKDIASSIYNPGGLAEASAAFDSTYDDMLIARVVTNASNVVTITALTNKDSLAAEIVQDITSAIVGYDTVNSYAPFSSTYNWARTPKNYELSPVAYHTGNGLQGWKIFTPDGATMAYNFNRYMVSQRCVMDELVYLQVKFSARA